MRVLTFALAGNPNCGKTTLFNQLTGSRQHTGNWPGVTVECKTGMLRDGGAAVVDLPGVYSLTPYSQEESIARTFLTEHPPDVIILIVDATCAVRSLRLTQQLFELERPLVIALNMMDEVRSRGGFADVKGLERRLGVPVVAVCARTGEGMAQLVRRALHTAMRPAVLLDETSIRAAFQTCIRTGRSGVTEKIDRVVMHPALALPVFGAVLFLIFLLTFGPPGTWLADRFAALVDNGMALLSAGLAGWGVTGWVHALLMDGVFAGVGSVLRFLPTLIVLFLLLAMLEDSGYMARAAFLMDRPLRSIGLSGRSFIPMMMGFGCTVPAVMSARCMVSRRDRYLTILLVPFMSCSAKMPVYALFAQTFLKGRQLEAMCLLYAAGVLTAAMAGMLLSRTAFAGETDTFILELPPYRMPTVGGVVRQMQEKTGDFLTRTFSIIFLASIGVWVLQSITFGLAPAQTLQDSMLGVIAGMIAPVLRPAGFGTPQAAAALLTGVLAKESVLSTLAVLANPLETAFPSPLSAASFLVFVLLYTPCTAALAAIRRETQGTPLALYVMTGQTALAWLAAVFVYQTGRLMGLG